MPLKDEQIKNITGLTQAQADKKLKEEGFNELPSSKKRSIFKIAFEVIKEPMFLLLVACGVIYLIIGEPKDAIMLLAFVFVIMGITVYQEGKTEHALEALRDLSSPRALVIRDSVKKRIAGREVVRGDIVVLSEGDRVPADGVLLWSRNLTADESLLTGESVSVRKSPSEENTQTIKMGKPGGDDLPFVYSGTLIVQGQGIALIKETGSSTEIGKIGKALEVIKPEETLLQKETGRLVKTIFLIALTLFTAVILIYGITRGNWLEGILSGITLTMALLPEEFPVVLTIFLALGAWRISHKQVLTRKMAAVETLGAIQVLCSDKTGTITQNKMSIKQIYARNKFYNFKDNPDNPIPEDFHELIEFAILSSKKDPFDPMEKSLQELGKDKLANTEHLHDKWTLREEYPLSKELLALSHVWRSPEGKDYIISAKGAPEAIFELCHMNNNDIDFLCEKVNTMAQDGLRVLGVAKSYFHEKNDLPDGQHDFTFEFIGLIGLEDPVRPAVHEAVKMCYEAGIQVVMITGDYPKTAQNIAKQIGLKHTENVITGVELENMELERLREKVKTISIFARVVPEQKLLLINAFKSNGQIVAMTGDGVNDAPSLKSANIGIAMGERGTDVAREASDMVLLDDDFSSIVAAIRSGRKIFDNLKKAMAYIVSVHIPIAGLALVPALLGWQNLILLPVHIVFLELVIDPSCSIVFEAEKEETDLMKREPRNPKEPLFGKKALFISVAQGLTSLIIVLAMFFASRAIGHSWEEARTLTFMTLITSNLCLILTNRNWSRTIISSFKNTNKSLVFVILGALAFLGLVIYIPALRSAFHFAPVHLIDFALAVFGGILSILWFEFFKLFTRKKNIELLKEN